jgi:stage II sporulation protein D
MNFQRIAAAILLGVALPAAAADPATALHSALMRTQAVAVLLDVDTGRVVASVRPGLAARQLSTPGSLLKPFFLESALHADLIQPDTAVRCNRVLHISGHTLNCGHPADPPALTARQAVAYSCNSYFAALAARMTPQQMQQTLGRYGLGAPANLLPGESSLPARLPRTVQEQQLLVLGIEGLRVSVVQVAAAYRRLALAIRQHPDDPALRTVLQGMQDSIAYGMAANAAVPGTDLAGKTGTATDAGRPHGWFVGIGPAGRYVCVIFIPNANGGDAARLARRFYQQLPPEVLPR